MPPTGVDSDITQEPRTLRPKYPFLEWVDRVNQKYPELDPSEVSQFYVNTYGPPPQHDIPSLESFQETFKRRNPTASDYDVRDFYDRTYGVAQRALGEPEAEKGDLFRGFKIALKQNPELAHGVSALAAASGETAFGEGGAFTAWKQSALKNYQAWADEIGKDSKKTDSITYAWEQASEHGNLGALVDFLQYGTGYIGGQVATVLGVGALASLLGGPVSGVTAAVASASAQAGARKSILQKVVGDSVKNLIDKEAAKLTAKGLTGEKLQQEAVKNASKFIASRAALLPYETFMEAGEIGGETVKKATEEGRVLAPVDIARNIGAAVAAGIVGFGEDIVGLRALRGNASVNRVLDTAPGIPGRVARAGAQGAALGAAGAGTEYVQTGIEQIGIGEPLDTPEAERARRDAAGIGALGGTLIGGVGGARQTALEEANPPASPPETEVDAARLRLRQEVERARQYSRRQQQDRAAASHEMEAVPNDVGVFDATVGIDEAIQRAETASGVQTDITDILTESMIDQALDTDLQMDQLRAEQQQLLAEAQAPETVGQGLPPVDLPTTRNNLGAFEGETIPPDAVSARIQELKDQGKYETTISPLETPLGQPEPVAPVPETIATPTVTKPLSARDRIRAERAKMEARRAYEPIADPQALDLVREPRSRLPDDQNAEILSRAHKAQADLEIQKTAPPEDSLIEFLRGRGGLQDEGGELGQLEIDKENKPFTKRLVRPDGLSLDDAAEAAHEAGLIEARDINLLLDRLDNESHGRLSAGPDWYKQVTTGRGKLSPDEVQTALDKIIADKGLDVGKKVEAVKDAILQDPEFAESGYAPRTDAEATDVQNFVRTEREEGRKALEGETPAPTTPPVPEQGAQEAEPAYGRARPREVPAAQPLTPEEEQALEGYRELYQLGRLTLAQREARGAKPETLAGRKADNEALRQKIDTLEARQRATRPSSTPMPGPREGEPDYQLTPPPLPKAKKGAPAEQEELFGTGETLQTGVAPIIGREVTTEEAPLFSKTAQEPDEEQGSLFEPAPAYAPKPRFYSQLQRTIEQKMPARASAEQAMNLIRKSPAVKDEEIEWSGIEEYLEGRDQETVTKQEVLDFLQANQVEVREVTKSGASMNERGIRIETRQRELRAELNLLHPGYTMEMPWNGMPGEVSVYDQNGEEVDPADVDRRVHVLVAQYGALDREIDEIEASQSGTKFSAYTIPGGTNYQERLLVLPARQKEARPDASGQIAYQAMPEAFRSSHFDEPNILAHLRTTDRMGPNGEKILFVEEVQSDWHQRGKKEGYQTSEKNDREKYIAYSAELTRRQNAGEINEEEFSRLQLAAANDFANRQPDGQRDRVPDAPFKKTWHELAMRTALREAVQNGYDQLAWITGEETAKRYDLSTKVDSIEVLNSGGNNLRMLKIHAGSEKIHVDYDNDGVIHGGRTEIVGKSLVDVIGKDIAEKVLSSPIGTTLKGVDLSFGGEWANKLYDQMIPSYMNKFAKKWGGKVVPGRINANDPIQFDEFDLAGEKVPVRSEPGYPAHVLPITPAMRQSIGAEGVSLFEPPARYAPEAPARPAQPRTYPEKLRQHPVKTKAIIESTGETITIEQNALEALTELDRDVATYRQLLECLQA